MVASVDRSHGLRNEVANNALAPMPGEQLVQKIKPAELLAKNLQSFTTSKPLNGKQFAQILSDQNFFTEKSLGEFDRYSFSLIQNLLDVQLQPETYEDYCEHLDTIFNDRLTDQQISRHLNNVFMFLYLYSCKDIFRLGLSRSGIEIKPAVIIAAQVSLLSVRTLMKGAEWAENKHDQRFMQHLVQFLELENERTDILEPKKSTSSSNFDLLSDLRSWMLSDGMMTSEPPCSLFEAGTINSALQMKYLQGPSTMAFALAMAGAGPSGLLCFAFPPLVTLATKIYKSFLDAPIHVNPLTDSRKLDLSCSKTFIGREDILNEIVAIWKEGRHPLLVGDPGVGKTAIMEAIARKIASGVIPSFKGKVVFTGSAADLTSANMMGTPHLQRAVREILPYKENVVLALDEFHAFMQATDKTLMTLVRSILDGSQNSLRYCIFATTSEDYEKHIKSDESLERRVRVIEIKPLDKNNLLHMLHIDAEQMSPLLPVSGRAMEAIYDKANALQNPSRLLLREVLRKAEKVNTSHDIYRQRQVKNAEIERNKLLHRSPINSLEEANQLSDAIVQAREELEKLQLECTAQDAMRARFILLKQTLIQKSREINPIAKQLYEHVNRFSGPNASDAAKIATLSNPNFLREYNKELKELVFLRYFGQLNLAAFVRVYAQIFGLVDVIDTDFVDKVWSEKQAAAAAAAALAAPAAPDANALAAPAAGVIV